MTSRKAKRSPRTTRKARKAGTKLGAASPRNPLSLVARTTIDVEPLFERVVAILEEARSRVVRTVNSAMVLAYWHLGREIVEFVQRGAARAAYGEQVIETLADRLLVRVGRGYSVRNLRYFRGFYLAYADREPSIRDARGEFGTSPVPNSGARIRHRPRAEFKPRQVDAVRGFSSKLTWSHYRTMTMVEDVRARAFYEIEAERERWSLLHLERQIHTSCSPGCSRAATKPA